MSRNTFYRCLLDEVVRLRGSSINLEEEGVIVHIPSDL